MKEIDIKKIRANCDRYVNDELIATLASGSDIKMGNSEPIEYNTFGSNTIPVLEFLNGLPMCNAILAYVHGLRPTRIRTTYGCVCSDSWRGRVTIFINEDNTVRRIEQEIEVGHSSGYALSCFIEALKKSKE